MFLKLATVLAIAVFIPNPTGFQYQVFRITLALAAGGVAAARNARRRAVTDRRRARNGLDYLRWSTSCSAMPV